MKEAIALRSSSLSFPSHRRLLHLALPSEKAAATMAAHVMKRHDRHVDKSDFDELPLVRVWMSGRSNTPSEYIFGPDRSLITKCCRSVSVRVNANKSKEKKTLLRKAEGLRESSQMPDSSVIQTTSVNPWRDRQTVAFSKRICLIDKQIVRLDLPLLPSFFLFLSFHWFSPFGRIGEEFRLTFNCKAWERYLRFGGTKEDPGREQTAKYQVFPAAFWRPYSQSALCLLWRDKGFFFELSSQMLAIFLRSIHR